MAQFIKQPIVNSLFTESIVYFGNEQLSTGSSGTDAPILSQLINDNNVEAIVVAGDINAKQNQAVVNLAKINNIRLLSNKDDNIAAELEDLNSRIAVLVAFGAKVSTEIINTFELGIVNVHPSLLPKYRGPTPIEQAIIDGLKSTGVSLMQLVEAIDSGPIFAREIVHLDENEDKLSLTNKLSETAARMLVSYLPDIISKKVTPQEQNHSEATFTQQINKQNGEISWEDSADEIERKIRAYLNWPGSYTILDGTSCTIIEATVTDKESDLNPGTTVKIAKNRLGVVCGDGRILEIRQLKPAGKKEMDASGFLAGRPNFNKSLKSVEG